MLTTKAKLLKIGELSTHSGVPIKTIRYYEELGLLHSSDRTEGNYRLFHDQAIARLALIKRLQTLGLSLQAIKECLSIYDQGNLPCAEIREQLAARVQEIEQKIQALTQLRQALLATLEHWQTNPTKTTSTMICPNLGI